MVIQTNPIIEVTISNGCYSLGWDSATGKSYLFNTLLNASRSGLLEVKVLCINALYDDMPNICEKLKNNRYDLVVVDRFDVKPSNELSSVLWNLRNNCVILVDCKDFNNFSAGVLDTAEVIYERGVLRVNE